jgi:glycosyltransferase involved in cell wall biosynthesis
MPISIIIPVAFGRDAHVALASLYHSGIETGDEVILVGDGHTPVCQPEFASLPLRFLGTPIRTGANAARNLGAQTARNEILCFLDDDDEHKAYALQRIRATVTSSKDESTGAWSLSWVIASGRRPMPAHRPAIITEPAIWRRNIAGGCSCMVVCRSIFDVVGGFDPTLPAMQDWDMWLRLSRTTSIRAVRHSLIRYHDHTGPRISTNLQARIAGLQHLLNKHAPFWPPRVRALHQARLAALHYSNSNAPLRSIFQLRAPLASSWFILRALVARRPETA